MRCEPVGVEYSSYSPELKMRWAALYNILLPQITQISTELEVPLGSQNQLEVPLDSQTQRFKGTLSILGLFFSSLSVFLCEICGGITKG